MLSVNLIQRYSEAQEWSRIVKALAGNGMPLPLPLQSRLSFAAPATALALRRVAELTYGPTALSRALTAQLLHLQRPDGSFPAGAAAASGAGDALATAAAVAGLSALLDEPAHRDACGPQAEWALERALAALAAAQDEDGLFVSEDDRTWQDRAQTSAFVLALLSANESFRGSVRVADLLTWFEENESRLESSTLALLDLARADAPRPVAPSRAVAAIAA